MSIPAHGHSPGFLALVNEAKSRIREIDIEELKRMMAAGTAGSLIDVREESEYRAGHVRGAIHLSKGVLERDIEATFPDGDSPLILYCGGGYRSALAADNLRKMGYTNVLSLDGGWRALEPSGVPLEISSE